MTFKLPAPVAYRFSAPGIVKLDSCPHGGHWHGLYTHAQLLEALRDWSEELAKVCESKSKAEYATGKVDHHEIAWVDACAMAIREKAKELV